MNAFAACAFACLLTSAEAAGDTLDIYVVDTEGGKAMIVRTPDGETLLVDAGYPTPDDRDTQRIVEAAQAAGIRQFDYVVATHYDADHSGNVAQVVARIPGKVFIDHGEPMPGVDARNRRSNYEPYLQAIGDRKRVCVQPGDVLPIKGCRITVVSSAGKTILEPLPGGGQPNPLCPPSVAPFGEKSENAGSVGLLYEFGKFRMLDLADLLAPVEHPLVCPRNLVGTVDLFMVSHHGLKVSNSKFLVHAVRPRVAIMNNGARKGGEPETLDILMSSPGLEDIWQLHHSVAAGDKNAEPDFIANLQEPCAAKLFKVTVQRDGAFTVANSRNGFSRTYRMD